MNWFGLFKCILIIACMLAAYLVVMNSKWKAKFEEYPFLLFGIIILALCVVGILIRLIFGI